MRSAVSESAELADDADEIFPALIYDMLEV
jgi:hypothetical protein